MKRPIPTRPDPAYGLIHLRPGQWASAVSAATNGETLNAAIDRVVALVQGDSFYRQQAQLAVAGWPQRESFLIAQGFPGQLDREQAFITALQEAGV